MNTSLPELLKRTKELKILYVEDNKDSRLFTLEMLTRFFDYISIAKDGKEGLEKFNNEKFDLVLTDINMPKMDGIELISAIKEIDPNIICLVLSAHNEKQYLEKAYNSGVQYYLAKPLSLTELVETLHILFMHNTSCLKEAQ